MDNEQEQPQNSQKITARTDKTELKHQAALLLSDAGMSYGAIAQVIDRHPQTVKTTVPRLRRESLSAPHRVKLAAKTVDAVMTGFLGKKVKAKEKQIVDGVEQEVEVEKVEVDPRVKASDAMRAAELSYSRAEPVKPDPATGVGSQTFIQVNQQFVNQLPGKDHATIEGKTA